MKVVIAPDKFKGCLSAAEVAEAMAQGVRRANPAAEIDLCPVADGGEGTVAALVAATDGRIETRRVIGPRPDMEINAVFGVIDAGKSAVIEMSAASGLALLSPEDRDPMRTTSFGTGQLLLEAAKLPRIERILLGIGGSATVDGGIGASQACGLPVILDGIGPADTSEPLVGEDLERVVLVKHARGSPIDRVKITVASDVTNPLFGPNGAARVFGPQKGATPGQVDRLDFLLKRLAERCDKLAEASIPGAGAAGGMGFAMLAFFHAELKPGFDIVADAVHLRDRLAGADLCLTGEGRLDRSSLGGKASVGVGLMCKQLDVPCAAVVGSRADDLQQTKPFRRVFALQDGGISTSEAMQNARELLADRAEQAVRALGGLMLIRLIRKLILALSVLLAIALVILWSRTRQSDLVISNARFGAYREFRLGRSRIGVMQVTTWPQDQPTHIGRVGKPSSEIFLKNPMATVSSAIDQNGLPLLDGSQLTLAPSSTSWWPPVRSTGSATGGTSYTAGTTGGNFNISSGTTTLITRGGTLSIQQQSSLPTTSSVPAGNTLVITGPSPPTKSGTFTFRTAKLPATAPSAGTGSTGLTGAASLTITGGTLILFATYVYTRFALPIWAAVLIVLLPVWYAVLVATLRWRRKRIRRQRGLCERCGYDLRGNPTGSACPECGAPTYGIPAPPSGEQLIARLK